MTPFHFPQPGERISLPAVAIDEELLARLFFAAECWYDLMARGYWSAKEQKDADLLTLDVMDLLEPAVANRKMAAALDVVEVFAREHGL